MWSHSPASFTSKSPAGRVSSRRSGVQFLRVGPRIRAGRRIAAGEPNRQTGDSAAVTHREFNETASAPGLAASRTPRSAMGRCDSGF